MSGFPEFGPKRALELAASNGRPVSDPLVPLEIKEATVFIGTFLELVFGAVDATYDGRRLEKREILRMYDIAEGRSQTDGLVADHAHRSIFTWGKFDFVCEGKVPV
jgi:hypothetical protein